jgi:hypothetical protein
LICYAFFTVVTNMDKAETKTGGAL